MCLAVLAAEDLARIQVDVVGETHCGYVGLLRSLLIGDERCLRMAGRKGGMRFSRRDPVEFEVIMASETPGGGSGGEALVIVRSSFGQRCPVVGAPLATC